MNAPGNTNSATSSTLASAEATYQYAQRLIEPLRETRPEFRKLSMAPRQATELVRFLEVHCEALQERIDKAREKGSLLRVQNVLTCQTQLEEALQFVQQAFIAVRSRESVYGWIIEAADWLCVAGFRRYVEELDSKEDQQGVYKGPTGPLVALDARRTPAVWSPDAALPMPSLFQRRVVPRAQHPNELELAYFPVICLPSNIARAPEFFPLLSHEVGHALDSEFKVTEWILKQLSDTPLREYWVAWMREMVADAFGLMLSGEAFLSALSSYTRFISTGNNSPTASSEYPSKTLRLQFLADAINNLGRDSSEITRIITMENPWEPNNLGQELRQTYQDKIHDLLYNRLLHDRDQWRKTWLDEQKQADLLVDQIKRGQPSPAWASETKFRLVASAFALASRVDEQFDTFKQFENFYKEIRDDARPDWFQSQSQWEFNSKLLPTFRHTILAPDGQTKVPPEILLISHDNITFVGATNSQLTTQLKKAYDDPDNPDDPENSRQKRPWEQIELFFASNSLLRQIEREEELDLVDLINERNEAHTELLELLRSGYANHWAIYYFDGPPLFGAYCDWNEPGGRIHISPQLLGTNLRQCPALDHIWYNEVPSSAYARYQVHLEALRQPKNSKRLETGCGNWQPRY